MEGTKLRKSLGNITASVVQTATATLSKQADSMRFLFKKSFINSKFLFYKFFFISFLYSLFICFPFFSILYIEASELSRTPKTTSGGGRI